MDAADDEGHAALCFCCKSGHCVCLRYLLEQRAHLKRFEKLKAVKLSFSESDTLF